MSEVMGEYGVSDAVEHGGDLFEDEAHVAMDKPLDTGRLLYARLCLTILADTEVEVWFDHFDNTITAQLRRGDDVREVTFYDAPMARVEKLVYVNAIVNDAKGAFE